MDRSLYDKKLEDIRGALRSAEGFSYPLPAENKDLDNEDYGFEIEGVGAAALRIKVFLKATSMKMQTEIRARGKSEAARIQRHFDTLGYDVLRKDHAFLPSLWQRKNMTDSVSELVERILILVDMLEAQTPEELSQAALGILKQHTKKGEKKQ